MYFLGFVLHPNLRAKEQIKSIKSLQKNIEKHQKKIGDFKANPTVKPGMENLPKGMIKKQQEARVNNLKKQTNTFKNNIENIKKGSL